MPQSDLGRVAHAMEHGFTGKKSADGDAINAPNQASALPALQAVGVTLEVKSRVGLDKLRADPRGPAARRRLGAAFDHLSELLIEADLEGASSDQPGQAP